MDGLTIRTKEPPTPQRWVLALEFGGQSVKAARVNTAGELIGPFSFSLDQQRPLSLEAALKRLSETIQLAKAGTEVCAVGIGAPSPYESETLTFHLEQKPGYRHINGFSLRSAVAEYAGCTKLWIENDAVVATKGEIWKGGHISGQGRYICLTLGTGLGACYVLDGRIVRGQEFDATSSGELWDFPYEGEFLEENVGTTKAVVKSYIARGGNDRRVISGDIEYLANRAKIGDELASDVFRSFGMSLAKGLAEPIRKFRPRSIVLSGQISNAFNFFERDANQLVSGATVFVKSELIGRGGLLGAAFTAFGRCLDVQPTP